jgi:hypothetical protein
MIQQFKHLVHLIASQLESLLIFIVGLKPLVLNFSSALACQLECGNGNGPSAHAVRFKSDAATTNDPLASSQALSSIAFIDQEIHVAET